MNTTVDRNRDYPLGSKRQDLITTFTGKRMADITLTAIMEGRVTESDIRISSRTLLLQAQIADQTGRSCLARNFRRAAELCHLPDDKVLEVYNALRPFRCTYKEIEALADEIENRYGAALNAELVREAGHAYRDRGLLRNDPSRGPEADTPASGRERPV